MPLIEGTEGAEADADQHLEPDDREVLHYYSVVQDQVENLCQFGKEPVLVPRLADWLAGAELCGIDPADRPRVVALARLLHDVRHGRGGSAQKLAAHQAEPQDLRPPEPPE